MDRSDRKVTVNNQKVSFKRNTAASGGGRGSSGSGRSSTEVDVRGMTTDEAIMEVDRFLDSCVLSHIGTVTVIHGKGTGYSAGGDSAAPQAAPQCAQLPHRRLRRGRKRRHHCRTQIKELQHQQQFHR